VKRPKTIEPPAWDGFTAIITDRKLGKRLISLLNDIDRTPYSGIGKPEPLKGRFGEWSRRIDKYHRLVYKIVDEAIVITECGGHYEG
jgi:toxin YoeB